MPRMITGASTLLIAICAAALQANMPPPQPRPKKDPEPKKEEPAKEVSTIERVQGSLKWLADHQSLEGQWSADKFGEDSVRKNAKKTGNLEFVNAGKEGGDKGWSQSVDTGLTGLALLCFVGGGHDHKEGDYKETVRRAVLYLRKIQGNDGCFGDKEEDSFVYNHAIATMALCECYGLTGDKALKPACDKAVEFILNAQNPGMGWRYGVKPGENDTSFTGWAVLALKSAKLAGLELDASKAFAGASAWLDSVTVDVEGYPKTGYNSPGSDNARLRVAQDYDNLPTMNAINICARLFMAQPGWDNKNRTLKSQAQSLVDSLPAWDHKKMDFIYWYWGTLAAYQMGGDTWTKWYDSIRRALARGQRGFGESDKGTSAETLDEHGSFDAVDAWATAGGRVYGTAVNCLILEMLARYERIAKKPPKEEK